MKVMFLSLIVLLASTATWAQDCDPHVSVTDATCSDANNPCGGIAMHLCQSTTFEAPCTHDYTLDCEVTCTGGATCKYCEGEAYLYEGTTLVACISAQCGLNGDCRGQTQVPLERSVTYTLYACKLRCEAIGTCSYCSDNCTTRAKVIP